MKLKIMPSVFAQMDINEKAFVIACIAIVVVSLLTKKPEQEIIDEFNSVRNTK